VMAAATFLTASAATGQRQPARATSPTRKAASTSAVSFADVTRASGIDFHLTCGGREKRYIMESMCGGVARPRL